MTDASQLPPSAAPPPQEAPVPVKDVFYVVYYDPRGMHCEAFETMPEAARYLVTLDRSLDILVFSGKRVNVTLKPMVDVVLDSFKFNIYTG